MAIPHIAPFDPDMVETSADYLHTATDIHSVVCGSKAIGWYPKVRGTVDGAVIGIAWWHSNYEHKVNATKRARQMLAHVKAIRATKIEESV